MMWILERVFETGVICSMAVLVVAAIDFVVFVIFGREFISRYHGREEE